MNRHRLASGRSAWTRRRAALIAALTLPLSLMSAPAIADGPTPSAIPATPPDAAPDSALKTAWGKAAKSGKPVELPSQFTETMKVWANPDGKNLRAELHTRPIQLKNLDSGAWEPIDTRIVTRDGKLQAARVKSPLTFGGRGAKHLVSAAGKHGEIGLGVTRALPEPKVVGNAVTYPDAVAPGADLVVLAEADGFTSQVVFRQRPTGPVTVRLPLTLPEGTTFGKTPQGLPQLKGDKGEAKAAPIVLTATDAKVEAAPEQGRTSSVKARVETTGKTSELVFSPDETFLADPAVTYPVTVAASSIWFGGGAPDDAWISRNDPYNNNAAAGYLRAGTTSTSADVARVYLKFNTSDPVLQGATVNDADLRIWNYKSGGPNGQLCGETMGTGIRAARVTSEWTLDGTIDSLDWYNQPPSTAPEEVNRAGYNYDADPASWCAKDEELFYEVTAMTRAWIQQGAANHGIVLKAASETAAINWRQYYSSQFGGGDPYPGYRHPPALIIDYTPAPPPVVDGFTFTSPDPITSLPTWEEARARSIYEPTGGERTRIDSEFAGRIAGQRDGEAFEVKPAELDLPADGSDGDGGNGVDTTAPQVTAVEPANGAVDVPLDAKLKVTFSEPVNEAAVVLKDAGGAEVTATMASDSTNTTVTVTPTQALKPETTYTAVVSGAIDPAENTMDPYSWSFTTGGPDTTAPTVTATNPTSGATNVPVTTPVTATFSEAVTDAQFTLKNPAGTAVAGTTAMDATQRVLTFTPAQPLAAATAYTGEVSGAKDAAGNAMAGPYTWSFTTAADTPPPVPGLVAAYGMNEGSGTSVADSSGQSNTGASTDTGWADGKYGKALSFNGSSSWVTVQDAASLRLTTGMTLSAWVNPASVADWSSVLGKELSATRGASYLLYAANSGSVPSGWVETAPEEPTTIDGFEPLPVNAWSHLALTYNGTYLRLFVNGQRVMQTPLTGSLHDDGSPLRIGGNSMWGEYFSGLIDEVRVYDRALTAVQIQADMNTPVGSGTPNPDTTPPTVTAVTPAAQATDVPVTTPVTATFSEAVTNAQFTLKNPAGVAVAGTTAMDATGRMLTFTPAQPLAEATAYTAEVSGAKDAAGNAMAGPYTWSFTTGVKPPTGLVAAYGMNEGAGTTVGDSSGQHNTGAARDTTWATGRHGTALSFNGTSSWVTVPHATSLRLTDTLTLSAWVRPSALGNVWRSVLMKEHAEVGGVYGLYASSEYTAPAGWLQSAEDGGALTDDGPLPLNQWSHLALSYDGGMATLYVNGTQVAQALMTGDILDDGGVLRIGGNSFWNEFYRGLIDEVRVYNRVQSAAEIQADMNSPVGAVPVARRAASTGTTPAIAKLEISDDKGTTPTFTAWVTDPQGRPATVQVEVAPEPARSSKPRLSKSGGTAAKGLTWSGTVTGKAGSPRHTLRVPSGKLKKGQWMRWRARATVPGTSGVWSEWQTFKVGDVRPGDQPPASARASQAPAAAANFQYKHPSLEDCYATTRAPRFTDAYSRMQERPHSACWTSWIGHGGWEEYDDNGVKKRKNRTAWWVRLFPGPLRIPAAVLDKVTDDDVFTFRATWVAHTYIGDHTGNAVFKGGTGGAGLKPQNIKFFVKLTDFGVWNRGVKRTELDDDLNDVQIEFDLATQGCQVQQGNPTQLKTIAAWRSTPYLQYLINTPKPAAHDREVCSIMPALTQYKENKGRLPLWDQELLGDEGKRLGVVRWGQGIPSNSLYSPSYRCDWKQLGFGKNEEKNTGGCIYIRADRVFTMSKSADSNFIGVINHIEKALSRSTNADTNPPFRPGDTTSNRDVKYPPHKYKTGTELPKAIPGNYRAAPNTTEGAPLWRGADGAYDKNRAVFSGHEFWVHTGWSEEFHMGNSYGSNYCKYYNQDLYQQHGNGALRCDEYPFASTQEGAAKDKINYSVQAVFTSYNAKHGEALQAFYSQYRLLTYDPVNTITKVSDSPFWVQIVE